MGLRRPKAVIEGSEEFGAELRGDDSASSPVDRIGPAFDQFRGFQLIEEVSHDRSVDSEVLGQGELATDSALSRGQDHAQAPSEVACQRADAAWGPANIIRATSTVIHPLIIGEKALFPRLSV